MAIKVFRASSFSYTPFNNFGEGDLDYLTDNGIRIVDSAAQADVIISQNYKHLKKHFWRAILKKKFLVWTLESRFDTHFVHEKNIAGGLAKCHFMNVYTKDVFASNITFHTHLIDKELSRLEDGFRIRSRRIIGLMSYYDGINAPALIRDGENIDLIALRSSISLEGSRAGIMDVFGKGWPEGISKEDSRDGDWVDRKQRLLGDYDFNLCFENTAAYNYMTEKIWDSIENYCLPIYYGKHTNAYGIFPKDSFIDYADFNSPAELFDFISTISDADFLVRINKCIDTYNKISRQHQALAKAEREKMLSNIVDKLRTLSKKGNG